MDDLNTRPANFNLRNITLSSINVTSGNQLSTAVQITGGNFNNNASFSTSSAVSSETNTGPEPLIYVS